MKKQYEITESTTASGSVFHVYIREDGICTDSRRFHSKQKGKHVVGTARERCEAFCQQLREQGYEEIVPQAVKDFREAMSIAAEVHESESDKRAAMESVIAAMPTRDLTPQDRYEAKTIRRYALKINRNTDADILDHLESMDNVQGYIKELIRDDLRRRASK